MFRRQSIWIITVLMACATVVGCRTSSSSFSQGSSPGNSSVVLAMTIHNPGYDFAFFGGDFGAVVAKNFFNRGAATFFKDVTTVGALLCLWAYGPGRLALEAREGRSGRPFLRRFGLAMKEK